MIPLEIQKWIEKDQLYLTNCTPQEYQKYVDWFYDPDHDIEPNWYSAMDQFIQDRKNK